MKQINLVIEGYVLKKETESKEQDVLAWNIGRYVQIAIASNMSKNQKYPKKPNTMEEKQNGFNMMQSDEEMLQAMNKIVSKNK